LALYEWRREIMASQSWSLTDTYNRFHDRNDSSGAIQKLRDLHIRLDCAVAGAYKWNDLDLAHDFHDGKQGTPFATSEQATAEVLARLLSLNYERYAVEVRRGLHDRAGSVRSDSKDEGDDDSFDDEQ